MRRSLLLLLLLAHFASFAQIKWDKEFKDDSVYLFATNELPLYTRLALTKDDSTAMIPLPEGEERILILKKSIADVKDTSKVLDGYQLQVRLGRPDAIQDESYRYLLPYPRGKTYELNQANGGSYSHNKPSSYYAFDFRMLRGDTITAARGGTVIWTESIHGEGEPNMDYYNKANRIIIEHVDGTLGSYLHLLKDGVFVEIGDKISAGQVIGLSGNSGYSDGPHLHFMVQIDGISKKIRFKNQPKTLKKGNFYRRR